MPIKTPDDKGGFDKQSKTMSDRKTTILLTFLLKHHIVVCHPKIMPMKKIFSFLAVALLLVFSNSVQCSETPASQTLSILKSVPLAELPGKAAALVSAAPGKKQVEIAVDVVRAAVGLNPAGAPAIVASISAGTPAVAPTVAATAASLLPQQAAALAQIAAASSPKMAGKIVEAVCKVVPDAYRTIAEAVAKVVPDASKEILAGVAAALPALKDDINNVLAVYATVVPPVNLILAQVADRSGSLATLSTGMPVNSVVSHGHPGSPGGGVGYYQSDNTTPASININSGNIVPSGGQAYNSPGGNTSP